MVIEDWMTYRDIIPGGGSLEIEMVGSTECGSLIPLGGKWDVV
jgi:hypothetical protein